MSDDPKIEYVDDKVRGPYRVDGRAERVWIGTASLDGMGPGDVGSLRRSLIEHHNLPAGIFLEEHVSCE